MKTVFSIVLILLMVFGMASGVLASSGPRNESEQENNTPSENETPQNETPQNETPQNETPQNETPPGERGGDIVVSGSSQNLVIAEINTTENQTQNEQQDEEEIDDEVPDDVVCSMHQVTKSGTIPHQVIARFTNGQTITYQAYCMEPYQKAAPGTNLNNGGMAPAVIVQTVQSSDPSNKNNAYQTQLKIWALVTGGNVDTDQGEVASMRTLNGISSNQLNTDLDEVETEIKNDYGVSEDQIYGLTEFEVVDIFGNNLMENFLTTLRHLVGIYAQAPNTPAEETEVSDESSQNTTTRTESDQQTQTNQTEQVEHVEQNQTEQVEQNQIETNIAYVDTNKNG